MSTLFEPIQLFWSHLQSGIVPQLGIWNYILLATLVAIEGPIATLFGAAAASAGFMQLPYVFLAAAIGNFCADTLWYSIGYSGNIEWVFHIHRWFKDRKHLVEKLTKGMRDHSIKILLFTKLTAGLMIPSLIAAGLARVPLRRWLPAVVTGEMVWTGTLVLIGFYATEAIKNVAKGVEYIALAGSIALMLIVIIWLRKTLQKNSSLQTKIFNNDEISS